MAYKLAEEDKLCGVIYPTYEGFSPIPKVTCDMLESKCEQTIIVKCGEPSEEETVDKVLGEIPLENLPTTEIGTSTNNTMKLPDESTIEDFKKVNKANLEGKLGKGYTVEITVEEPNKVGEKYTEETVNIEITTPSGKKIKRESLQKFVAKYVDDTTSESTSGSQSTSESSSTSESTSTSASVSNSESKPESSSISESTSVSESTSESTTTSTSTSVSTSESTSVSSSTESSNTPEEPKPSPEPQPEPVPTIDLLEVLPRVEDKFSKIITKDGQVVEVPEVSNEDKRAFEDNIINDLKAKLPEGTVVEAVLEGPKYEKGSEVLSGKTNYVLNVRTTLNGVVSEQTYNVPHTEEAPKETPENNRDYTKEVDSLLGDESLGQATVDSNLITKIVDYTTGKDITDETLPEISERYKNSLENYLNDKYSGYKVNNYTIRMDKHVGDYMDSSSHIFSYSISITAPDGSIITKDGNFSTPFIETL